MGIIDLFNYNEFPIIPPAICSDVLIDVEVIVFAIRIIAGISMGTATVWDAAGASNVKLGDGGVATSNLVDVSNAEFSGGSHDDEGIDRYIFIGLGIV